MKLIRFLLLVLVPFSFAAQVNMVIDQNLDWYKPYTKEAQEYLILNDKVSSYTSKIQVEMSIVKRNHFEFGLGINYKRINHQVKNKINYFVIFDGTTKYSPADIISKSHSIGLNFYEKYNLINREKYNGQMGINSTFYVFEIYNSEYKFQISDAGLNPYFEGSFHPFNNNEVLFPLSSIDLSIFYINRWQLKDNFSLGARISLGTNLYSDWDQFKKYAWVGLGLEMGFGKVKTSKVNP
jgi:hypothetical protein